MAWIGAGREKVRLTGAGRLGALSLFSLLAALIVTMPLMSVAVDAARPASDVWGHVAGRLVPRYFANTVWLCLGVGLLTAAIGVGATLGASMPSISQ